MEQIDNETLKRRLKHCAKLVGDHARVDEKHARGMQVTAEATAEALRQALARIEELEAATKPMVGIGVGQKSDSVIDLGAERLKRTTPPAWFGAHTYVSFLDTVSVGVVDVKLTTRVERLDGYQKRIRAAGFDWTLNDGPCDITIRVYSPSLACGNQKTISAISEVMRPILGYNDLEDAWRHLAEWCEAEAKAHATKAASEKRPPEWVCSELARYGATWEYDPGHGFPWRITQCDGRTGGWWDTLKPDWESVIKFAATAWRAKRAADAKAFGYNRPISTLTSYQRVNILCELTGRRPPDIGLCGGLSGWMCDSIMHNAERANRYDAETDSVLPPDGYMEPPR